MSGTFSIRLRALEPEDAQVTGSWEHPVWVTLARPQKRTMEEEQAWLHQLVFDSKQDLALGVEAQTSGELLGLVFLTDVDRHHRHARLELLFKNEKKQASEYGVQAALLLLSHAFVVLGLERVEVRVRADHPLAMAWLDGSGFVREALLRQGWRQDDKRWDVQVGSMLQADFIQIQPHWPWPYPPR